MGLLTLLSRAPVEVRLASATPVNARAFTGTDVIGASGGLPDSTVTMTFAVVFRSTATPAQYRSMLTSMGGACFYELDLNPSENLIWYSDAANGDETGPTVTVADGWCLLAVSKTGGATKPRFHKYVFATGVWTHADATNTVIDSENMDTPETWIGSTRDSTQPCEGQLAVAGMWTSALSDGAIEALAASPAAWLSAGAHNVWYLDQAAVTTPVEDQVGTADETSRTGTTVVVNGGPPVWRPSVVGQSSATLAVGIPTPVPLAASSAVASTSLTSFTAPFAPIPIQASSGVSSASLNLTAPTQVPLAACAGQSSASLTPTAPTAVPFAASSATATGTLALVAKTEVPLAASSAVASAAAALSAPTQVPLDPAAGQSSASLAPSTPAPPVLLNLDPCNGQASDALTLAGPAVLALGPCNGQSGSPMVSVIIGIISGMTVLKPIQRFPAGTVVTAHPRHEIEERAQSNTTPKGATVTETATVAADGTLTFSAFVDDTLYGCFAHIQDLAITTTVAGSGGTNEVQVVTVINATGGTFTLTYSGQTTTPIAFDADAATVQAALIALSNLAPADVVVTGGAGGPYTLTFGGTLALTDVAEVTADAAGLVGYGNRWIMASGNPAA